MIRVINLYRVQYVIAINGITKGNSITMGKDYMNNTPKDQSAINPAPQHKRGGMSLYISLFTLFLLLALIGFIILAAFKLDRWKMVRTLLQEQLMVESKESGEMNRRVLEQKIEAIVSGSGRRNLVRHNVNDYNSWPTVRHGASAHFSGKFAIPAENLYTFLIEEISPLPEAENATYPDCLRTARAKFIRPPDIPGIDIISMKPEVILVFWAFQDRKHSLGSDLKEGDLILGWPYDGIAGDFSATQTSDTVDYEGAQKIFLAQQTPSSVDGLIVSQPVSPIPEARTLRQATVERIEWELKTYGNNNWSEWMKRTQPLRDQIITLNTPHTTDIGKIDRYTHDVTDIFKSSFNYNWDEFAYILNFDDTVKLKGMHGQQITFVQHIKELSDSLSTHGITLVFVPIPTKSVTCPSIFLSPDQLAGQEETAPTWRKVIHDLALAGVDVVDLTPVFRDHWREYPDRPLYLEDHHLSPLGLKLTAEAVARYAAGFVPEYDRNHPGNLTMLPSIMEYNLKPFVDVSRTVEADIIRIKEKDDTLVPFVANRKSPIIVYGDSTMYVALGNTSNNKLFYGASVAGFRGDIVTQISFALNHVADEGSGTLILSNPGLEHIPANRFDGKKALIVLNMYPHFVQSSRISDAWISSDVLLK